MSVNMEGKPLISVCIPMHHASRYLRECFDSVLAQTYADSENDEMFCAFAQDSDV